MAYTDALRHRYSVAGQEYLITCCTQNKQQYLQDFHTARAVARALKQLEEEGLAEIKCWVVMPDHIHLLIQLVTDKGLARIIALLKVYASRNAGARIPWQKGYHERTLRSTDDRRDIARYIVMNPIRANLAKSVREYSHWDSVYL
ncbi:REP-associated tyrosine transposase [Marinobacter salicampi]|uniref:REP-associated tyrosine transposase n=1 Tax=Marinobacter salicampi TaxID=435907 RepID=UPI00140A66A2|nr:transposase [Marinobacter salicampi]